HLSFFMGTAPNFDEKLIFNDLTSPISERIRSNSQRVHLVDAFLQKSDLGSQQAIAQEIHAFYEGSKALIPANNSGAANDRYMWLLQQIIPQTALNHPHT